SRSPNCHWHFTVVFNCRWPCAWIHQLRHHQGVPRLRRRNQLTDVRSSNRAGVVLRVCAKPNVEWFGSCKPTDFLHRGNESPYCDSVRFSLERQECSYSSQVSPRKPLCPFPPKRTLRLRSQS